MTRLFTSTALSGGMLLALCAPLSAQEALPPIDVQAFELGKIKVGEQRVGTAQKDEHSAGAASARVDSAPTPRQRTDAFGGYTISNRQTETFARDTLERAVDIAPGVVSHSTGGGRNEQNIYVRGFDRWQVPLTVDGVRVYLPVDNRLDFARFLTPDIAEVQIAKGYVSVLDGPGGMGGQINLVSRKPTRELESEIRSQVEFGRDGSYQGVRTYGLVGTRQDLYYAQLSGAWQGFDGWMLPASYTPTPNQGSGFRDQSYTQDHSLNAKIGLTPNATDEYSLNFIRQEGLKGAPLHVTDPIATQRFWEWPYWRVQNLYFLSKTQIGESSHVKTRLYWSKFDNSLVSFDDPSHLIQAFPKSFNSRYADYALGAELEAATNFADVDTLKALFFYRLDNHSEWQENYGQNALGTRAGCVTNVPCNTQPLITSMEDTYSLALENVFHPIKDIDIVAGFGYDWRHLRQAQGFAVPQGTTDYRVSDTEAPNYQGAVIWRYEEGQEVHFNASSRVRYPTLFERFSTRFGGATSNPDLRPERATNFDLGWASAFAPKSRVAVDLFYSIVDDLIQSVPAPQFGVNVTQSQNVGDGRFWGGEVSADYFVRDDFSLGGNLTIMHRRVQAPTTPQFQPVGVPDVKLFLFAGYRPLPGVTLTPSIEMEGNRWTSTTNGAVYYRTGAHFLTNFNADYQVNEYLKLTAGARNLFDTAYTLTDGFPERGRSIYFAAKATF
ncbi:MAG: TonB-dependent receptor [Methylocystaceae bacterium]|nr:MAG: TonB-dependent receptor [Methylocystaceae bacterium]